MIRVIPVLFGGSFTRGHRLVARHAAVPQLVAGFSHVGRALACVCRRIGLPERHHVHAERHAAGAPWNLAGSLGSRSSAMRAYSGVFASSGKAVPAAPQIVALDFRLGLRRLHLHRIFQRSRSRAQLGRHVLSLGRSIQIPARPWIPAHHHRSLRQPVARHRAAVSVRVRLWAALGRQPGSLYVSGGARCF